MLNSFLCKNSGEANVTSSSNVAVSVLRAVTHRGRVTGVTNRPWPRQFRYTRTPFAPCTSPESTQPQVGVGETPLMNRTTPGVLPVSIPVDPHLDLHTKQTCQLALSTIVLESPYPTQTSQLLDCKWQEHPLSWGFS